ncbi:hypothetical protein Ccrd_003717 [Cynara cardunculus var. scolymus]|uniref:Acyl-[acyl-carrier-protein] hydrolase n=1 Tax=Cynara cardunculus var. scolymus TaxID=59895 RepID=A0A103XNX3_CYNCS|nr:hypothetical protein Ccrd_003717 [Cynara cardunculus var. scolymus]
MLSKGSPVAPAIYNASAKDATCALTQSRSIGSVSIRRKYNVFLCNLSSRKVSPLLAVATGEQPSGLASLHEAEKEKSLGNRLRLGSLTEDGLSYKEKFIIRCYEVGINKTATIETIANLLQEVGGNHAQSVGFSTDGFATTTTMRKLHLIWVTARMHIEVYRYPAWSDVIEIETWVQGDGRIGTRRDWILKDYANGEKVSDDVREEYLVFCPRTLRLAFPEENNNSLKKIAKLEDPAEYSRLGLVPRRSDLDMNKHVNNVTYIGWALEVSKRFQRECQRDDIVDSLTSREPLEDAEVIEFTGCNGSVPSKKDEQDLSRFMHLLRSSGNGLEINRCRTEWRKKPAKR